MSFELNHQLSYKQKSLTQLFKTAWNAADRLALKKIMAYGLDQCLRDIGMNLYVKTWHTGPKQFKIHLWSAYIESRLLPSYYLKCVQ